jgi:alginate O-acetyltransferase complex protein AlgI
VPFNSISFLFFFAFVGILYFSLPPRHRWMLLLGASYFFYMLSKTKYLFILVAVTFVNYFAGLQMEKAGTQPKRKKYLLICLFSNFGLLFLFKYYPFFSQSLKALFEYVPIPTQIPWFHTLLPLGISFYIFKNVSYAIDVYRREQAPEKHPGIYALYVAFFPQLLAGPIERAPRLLPQLHQDFGFDERRVTDGLRLILWGLFLKIVIADTLVTLVDPVYDHPTQYVGFHFLLATLFFAFQIYCDFAGYSYIAIGAGRVLGYQTMDNFNHPYGAQTISDFWRKWHISLSTWFRDYLYIPLGGNRVPVSKHYANLIIVFLICGLWHGANWTFVVWGGIHGAYLVFSLITRRIRGSLQRRIGLDKVPKIHQALKVLITFSLVCIAWVFFRANNISDAFYILSHLGTGWSRVWRLEALRNSPYWGDLRFEFLVGTASLVLLGVIYSLQKRWDVMFFSQRPVWIRWSVYYGMILVMLLFGNIGSKPFIYFQF